MKKLLCALIMLSLTAPVCAKSYVNKSANNEYVEVTLNKLYDKYINYVYEASKKTGLDMTEIAAFMKVESTFNPKAYNSKYGAAGIFQHIPSTWDLYRKRYAKAMGIPTNADVYNPKASIYIGAAALAAEKKQLAKDTYRNPEDIRTGELYLTHLYGYSKAVKIMNAPANTKVSKFVNVYSNSGLTYHNKNKQVMTTAEFIAGVNNKMEKEKSIFEHKSKDYQLTKFISSLKLAHSKLLSYIS